MILTPDQMTYLRVRKRRIFVGKEHRQLACQDDALLATLLIDVFQLDVVAFADGFDNIIER